MFNLFEKQPSGPSQERMAKALGEAPEDPELQELLTQKEALLANMQVSSAGGYDERELARIDARIVQRREALGMDENA